MALSYRCIRRNDKNNELEYYNDDGNIRSKWRSLYNEYCKKVSDTFDIDIMKRTDGRFVAWSKPDLTLKTFRLEPDTLPT